MHPYLKRTNQKATFHCFATEKMVEIYITRIHSNVEIDSPAVDDQFKI